MKDKIFSVLQRVGRSFMLPIAILPVAGLLLGIGSSFTNATTIETYGLTSLLGNGTILHALLVIMNKVGSAVFDNLPLIFAVGVAIGMAKKEKEVSALSAVIAYFVMNTAINAMLTITGQILENGEIAESVLEGTITSVCGIHCRWVCLAVLLSVLELLHFIIVFTGSSFRMHFLSLEVLVLYRLFLRSSICLWEL